MVLLFHILLFPRQSLQPLENGESRFPLESRARIGMEQRAGGKCHSSGFLWDRSHQGRWAHPEGDASPRMAWTESGRTFPALLLPPHSHPFAFIPISSLLLLCHPLVPISGLSLIPNLSLLTPINHLNKLRNI